MRAVGVPDEDALAAAGLPEERAGQRLAAGQVRRRRGLPSCARPRGSGHRHRRGRARAPAARPAHRSASPSRPRRRVVSRSSCAKRSWRASSSIDAAWACIVNGSAQASNRPLRSRLEQLVLQVARPAREPALEHDVALDRPAEGIVRRRVVERRVEVREVVPEHAAPADRCSRCRGASGARGRRASAAEARPRPERAGAGRRPARPRALPSSPLSAGGTKRWACCSPARTSSVAESSRSLPRCTVTRAAPRSSSAEIASRRHCRPSERRMSGTHPARTVTPPSSMSRAGHTRPKLAPRLLGDQALRQRDACRVRTGSAHPVPSRLRRNAWTSSAASTPCGAVRDDDEPRDVAGVAPAARPCSTESCSERVERPDDEERIGQIAEIGMRRREVWARERATRRRTPRSAASAPPASATGRRRRRSAAARGRTRRRTARPRESP